MTKVTDGNNTLVKIPKFWVKVTHSPFKVQIADQATDGFQVSPATETAATASESATSSILAATSAIPPISPGRASLRK